jgi:hypothetical protein
MKSEEGLYGEPCGTHWCLVLGKVEAPTFGDCESDEERDALYWDYVNLMLDQYGVVLEESYGGPGRPFTSAATVRVVGKRVLFKQNFGVDI